MSDLVGNVGPGLRITVGDAEALARRLLGEASERWRHTRGVARRAWQIAGAVEPADRPLLLAAAFVARRSGWPTPRPVSAGGDARGGRPDLR